MSQPTSVSIDSNARVSAELGSLVFACRNRARYQTIVARGRSPAQAFIYLVRTVALVPAAVVVLVMFGLEGLAPQVDPSQAKAVGGLTYLGLLLVTLRWVFVPSAAARFVLRERGFQYKNEAIRFDKLIAVAFEVEPVALEDARPDTLEVWGGAVPLERFAAVLFKEPWRARLALTFQGGQKKTLKRVGTECVADDVCRFCELIPQQRPHLLNEAF